MSIIRFPTREDYAYLQRILDTTPVTFDTMDLYIPPGLRAAAYLMLEARERERSRNAEFKDGKK
jgi:hypothetical protein